MKKVTAFIGSARKRNTYKVVTQYLSNLQAQGEVDCEIVTLSDYKLGFCRGCQICFNKGEALCPLKDDRDVLFAKIDASDGVIFATPNYTWDMSGIMKAFIDRLGYTCHRPRFFGKTFTSIVTQAIGRGGVIVGTLDFAARTWGFNTVKGITITAFDQQVEQRQAKTDRLLAAHSRRFYTLLARPAFSAPSLLQLVMFRFGRTMIKKNADPSSLDYHYYADNGWLASDYYYATQLGALKRAAGYLTDRVVAAM